MSCPNEVRTAIVHDWFQGFHGAERVVAAMVEAFGTANPPDIYTFSAARELLPPDLVRHIVKESPLAQMPGLRQIGHDSGRWRYLLPFMPTYFRRLDLDAYDIVVASSHACAINARPRADALYACYCYTPMRYVWMPETERDRLRGVRKIPLDALRGYLRRVDLKAAQRPDHYIAISEAVRERIRQFYGRDATVVHPPVNVEEFSHGEEKDPGHFLWAHRLVPYKQPELVMEAFRDLPFRLTMIGVGPLEQRLRRNLPPNVELVGWLPRAELARAYAKAAGFIHIGEEDFGITMVEALASGTPVIALDKAGARDIVRQDIDGLRIEQPGIATLRDAVRAVAARQWDPTTLAARARCFSHSVFLRRFADEIEALPERRRDTGRARL